MSEPSFDLAPHIYYVSADKSWQSKYVTLIAVCQGGVVMIGISFGEANYFLLKRDCLFIQKQETIEDYS